MEAELSELDLLNIVIDRLNYAAENGDAIADAQSRIMTWTYNQIRREAPGFAMSPSYRHNMALAKALASFGPTRQSLGIGDEGA